jgi:hypothetical protein
MILLKASWGSSKISNSRTFGLDYNIGSYPCIFYTLPQELSFPANQNLRVYKMEFYIKLKLITYQVQHTCQLFKKKLTCIFKQLNL